MKLSALHRGLVYGVCFGLFASGAMWTALRYTEANPAHGGAAWLAAYAALLKVHGAFAQAALVALGSLLVGHMLPGLRARLNLASGLAMGGTFLALAVTGYLLYYAGGELARAATSAMHTAIGIATPVLLIWHLRGRTRIRRAGLTGVPAALQPSMGTRAAPSQCARVAGPRR